MKHLAPIFKGHSAGFQLVTFIFLLLLGAVVGLAIGLISVSLFYEGGAIDAMAAGNSADMAQKMRILQLASQFGLLLLPPLIFAWLFYANKRIALGFTRLKQPKILLPALLIMLVSIPFIHWLSEWNQSIRLPEYLSKLEQWFMDKEQEAKRLTELFLQVSTIKGLLINLFMMAIVAAIGEELVFRSVFQSIFIKIFKNPHIGILFASILFSLIHFQFYGFIPRFILGLFLGYFYYWSGSIMVPIFMHFLNNALAVIGFYLHHNGLIDVAMEDLGTVSSAWPIILSFLLSFFLFLAGRLYFKPGQIKNA